MGLRLEVSYSVLDGYLVSGEGGGAADRVMLGQKM